LGIVIPSLILNQLKINIYQQKAPPECSRSAFFVKRILKKSKNLRFALGYDTEGGIMLMNPGVTLLRVERARKRLYQVQKKYGFLTHPKVIEQSMKLDELLNQYQIYKMKS
jgi:hypothetical protein